jgi:hypothetical protein
MSHRWCSLGRNESDGISSSFQCIAMGHGISVMADRTLILADELASFLVPGEAAMAHPVIDVGLTGFGDSAGPLTKHSAVGVLTILKKSSEAEDESVHVQVCKVPFCSLGNVYPIVDQLACILVGSIAYLLG